MAESVQASIDYNIILKDVPADRPKYEDGWDATFERKFSSLLKELDSDTIQLICRFLSVDSEADGVIEGILENQSEAITLYTLYRFIGDKKTLLHEMAERSGYEVEQDEEYHYLLKRLAEGNQDIVYKLLLYREWSDAKNRRSYEIQNPLPNDYSKRFDENFRSIQVTLAIRTRSGNFLYQDRNKISFEDSTIFAIDRQTSDREKRDVVGAQRRRNLRSVFVEVDEVNELVHLITNNQTIRTVLIEKIEEIFAVSLLNVDAVQNQMEVDADQFENSLLEEPESNLKIVNIEFKRTEITPSLPLTISKKSYDTEVRNVVRALSEDIVNPAILNVRRFWFSVDDIDTRVLVNTSSDDDLLRLDSKINTDSTYQSERIRRIFKETFGIPLDRDIPLHWVTGDRQQVISFILKNPPTYESQNIPHSDLIEQLDELGVITTEVIDQKQCTGCEGLYPGYTDNTCPSCGGELSVFAEKEKASFSERGVLSFFKKRLEEEGLEYLGTKEEQIYRTKYRFRRVRHQGDIVHVLINTPTVSITPKTIDHLNKSLNPVTLLNPGTVKNERLMEEVLATYIDLSELIDLLLEDTLPNDYIARKINAVTRATEEKTARNARSSFNQLQRILSNPPSYTGEEFEIEIFHIINQMITNAEQWGTKRRGNLPDGFAELLFKTGQGNYYRSFAWDGKFTTSGELEIGASEAKDLRDYIHRIKESTEVASSNTKFNNFVVVSNANPGNFEATVAERINRMTSWDGVPVLMHVNFLMALHAGFNDNVELIKRHIHDFYEQFYLALNDGKFHHRKIPNSYFVHLTAEDAESLLENFNGNIPQGSIDIESLREFMESDVFP